MSAQVNTHYSPMFAWWASITARKCGVVLLDMDFSTFDILVVGSEESKSLFSDEYRRMFSSMETRKRVVGGYN